MIPYFYYFYILIWRIDIYNIALVLFSAKPSLSMVLLSLLFYWLKLKTWQRPSKILKNMMLLSGALMPSSVLVSQSVSLTYSAVFALVLLELVAHCQMLKPHQLSLRSWLLRFSVVPSDCSESSLASFKLVKHEPGSSYSLSIYYTWDYVTNEKSKRRMSTLYNL